MTFDCFQTNRPIPESSECDVQVSIEAEFSQRYSQLTGSGQPNQRLVGPDSDLLGPGYCSAHDDDSSDRVVRNSCGELGKSADCCHGSSLAPGCSVLMLATSQ